MITDAIEVIVGVSQDPVFGPVLLLGMGGIFAEAMRDVSYRVAPVNREQALEMIAELRASSVFAGVRGRPACDVDALAEVLITISRLAYERRGMISEIDINPLMVRPQGKGVVAADALVVLN
jgi:acetyltransferase